MHKHWSEEQVSERLHRAMAYANRERCIVTDVLLEKNDWIKLLDELKLMNTPEVILNSPYGPVKIRCLNETIRS